jgi:hypothetical protein
VPSKLRRRSIANAGRKTPVVYQRRLEGWIPRGLNRAVLTNLMDLMNLTGMGSSIM